MRTSRQASGSSQSATGLKTAWILMLAWQTPTQHSVKTMLASRCCSAWAGRAKVLAVQNKVLRSSRFLPVIWALKNASISDGLKFTPNEPLGCSLPLSSICCHWFVDEARLLHLAIWRAYIREGLLLLLCMLKICFPVLFMPMDPCGGFVFGKKALQVRYLLSLTASFALVLSSACLPPGSVGRLLGHSALCPNSCNHCLLA